MKKILLFVLLLVCTYNLHAAEYEYVPLVREGVEWGYIHDVMIIQDGEPIQDPNRYYHIQFHGTKTIDGKEYHNCYRYYGSEFTPDTMTPTAYIREEGKKVYMIRAEISDDDKYYFTQYESNKEYLLYDFNLNAGDSFNTYDIFVRATVSSIEDVEITGKLRKKFALDNSGQYNDIAYIEGIGIIPVDESNGLSGDLIFPYPIKLTMINQPTSYLNYVKNANGEIEYKSGYFEAADPALGGVAEVEADNKLTVNVAEGAIKVSLDGSAECNGIEIYSTDGMMMARGAGNEIATGSLSHGVYLIKVNTTAGDYTKKVIL